MSKGLTTRIGRIELRMSKRNASFPPIVCTLFDVDDEAIIGLIAGNEQIARRPGETLDELLERARVQTGIPMWVAQYEDLEIGEVE
ncbi:hypothetical protein [Hyphomonas sp.]|uniref:hypothetical protein n=1 Tax=Hyphomonas sp. TaxID=87 RepID=UPI003919B005